AGGSKHRPSKRCRLFAVAVLAQGYWQSCSQSFGLAAFLLPYHLPQHFIMACPLVFGMLLLFMSGGPTAAVHLAIHPSDLVDASVVDPGKVNLVLGKEKTSPQARHVAEDFTGAVFEAELAVDASEDPVAADGRTEEPCENPAAGDHCRKAVEWSREVGIGKHPDWYPNLTAESSFQEVQESLWRRGKAGCRRPCPEPETTTVALPKVEDMTVDQLQGFINKEWDGGIPQDVLDGGRLDDNATSNASSENEAVPATSGTGAVPMVDGAQSPESIGQAGYTKNESEVAVDAAPTHEALQESTDQDASRQEGDVTTRSQDSWDKRGEEVSGGEPTLPQDGGTKNESEVAVDAPLNRDAAPTQEAPQESTDQDAPRQEDDMTTRSEDSWGRRGEEGIGGEPTLPQDGDAKNQSEVAVDAPSNRDAAPTQEAPQESTDQDASGPQEDDMTTRSNTAEGLPATSSTEHSPESPEQTIERNSTAQEDVPANAPGLEDGTSRLDLPSADAAQQTGSAGAPVAGKDADTPGASPPSADAPSGSSTDGAVGDAPLPLVDSGDASLDPEAAVSNASTGEPADASSPDPPTSGPAPAEQPGAAAEALGAGAAEDPAAGGPEEATSAGPQGPEGWSGAGAQRQDDGAGAQGAELPAEQGSGAAAAGAGQVLGAAGAEGPAGAGARAAVVGAEPLPEVDEDGLDEAGRAEAAEKAERAREMAEAEEQMRRQVASELREEMAAHTSTTEESLESMKERIKAEIKQQIMKEQMEAKIRAEIMREMMASVDTDGTSTSPLQ
ncbi:unnamed protein product, partial [Prorocentrum cordatum]